jgi:hypothetical protein
MCLIAMKVVDMRFILLILLMLGTPALAYDEPKYEVLDKTTAYEVRLYGDRIVVRTFSSGSSSGFRKLFGYISGANTSQAKVSMTVPVSQSEKIDMTTPVAEQSTTGGSYMSFYLPAQYTMATAPVPTDPAVELSVDRGGKFAVLQFSGRSTDGAFAKQTKLLREALVKDGVSFEDLPIRATYNAPFTPGFMRRNEIMFRLK